MKKILKEWRTFLKEEEASSLEAVIAGLRGIELSSHKLNPVQALTGSPAVTAWALKTFAEVVGNTKLETVEALTNQLTRSRVNPRTGKRIDFEPKEELQNYKEFIEEEIFGLFEEDAPRIAAPQSPSFWANWVSEDQDFLSREGVFFRYLRNDVKKKFKDELFNERFPAFYDELFKRSEEWRELVLKNYDGITEFKVRRAGTATNIIIGNHFGTVLQADFKEVVKDLYLTVSWALKDFENPTAQKIVRLLLSEDPKNVGQGLEFGSMAMEFGL